MRTSCAFGYNTSRQVLGLGDNISLRIYEDGSQAGVIIGFAVEQKQAGVSSDGYLDFISNPYSAATFEIFFAEENRGCAAGVLFGLPAANVYSRGHFFV